MQTDHTTIAFESFWSNLNARAMYPEPWGVEDLKQKYLDINPEGMLFRESQDVAEELRIMARIYNQQLTVVKDFRKHLAGLCGVHNQDLSDPKKLFKLLEWLQAHAKEGNSANHERERRIADVQSATDFIKQIVNRLSEIHELEGYVGRTSQQVRFYPGMMLNLLC